MSIHQVNGGSSATAVQSWLSERKDLLVSYCQLTGERNQQQLPSLEDVSRFCDILVDYVSAGHFEIYQDIVSRCEATGPDGTALLKRCYPQIEQTTDVALEFNDRYSGIPSDETLTQFDEDLCALGLAIAKRIDLEDQLIDVLKTKDAMGEEA